MRVRATNIHKFIITILQENKTVGADVDEWGTHCHEHHKKNCDLLYFREDLTASWAARTKKQFTDRSSNGQPLHKQVDKQDVAVGNGRSNSCAKAPSLSTEFSEASRAAETIQQFADKSSNGQPLNKAEDKEGVTVEKETMQKDAK